MKELNHEPAVKLVRKDLGSMTTEEINQYIKEIKNRQDKAMEKHFLGIVGMTDDWFKSINKKKRNINKMGEKMKIKKIRKVLKKSVIYSFVGVNLNNLGILIYKLTFPNEKIEDYYKDLFFTFVLFFFFSIIRFIFFRRK